jgi:hypothetical protein
MTETQPDPALQDIGWYPSYDRAAVEEILAALDQEWYRLQTELTAAEQRLTENETAHASQQVAVRDRTGELVATALEEFERIHEEQRAAVTSVKAQADREVERILSGARSEADAIRTSAARLASLADGSENHRAEHAWSTTDLQRPAAPNLGTPDAPLW